MRESVLGCVGSGGNYEGRCEVRWTADLNGGVRRPGPRFGPTGNSNGPGLDVGAQGKDGGLMVPVRFQGVKGLKSAGTSVAADAVSERGIKNGWDLDGRTEHCREDVLIQPRFAFLVVALFEPGTTA